MGSASGALTAMPCIRYMGLLVRSNQDSTIVQSKGIKILAASFSIPSIGFAFFIGLIEIIIRLSVMTLQELFSPSFNKF